ncbi:MAG: aldehyde dehydrogenase family protein [Oscillospiraceae bacterium]|nr:aldehyde dehydrogenase family protein [Oscillospiraceae bacterium]
MEFDSKAYITGYIERARKAQATFEKLSQKETDAAVRAIAKVVYDNAQSLAEIAVEETGMGNVSDKILKNKNKSKMIWNHLKDKKSKGIIERDEIAGIVKLAKPVGVVAAISPVTNPSVTPMGNAMFALKGGNAIIITPHNKAIKCSTKTVEMMNAALEKLGMPENLIQILDVQSRENTKNLISMADIVVATGGMGMVGAAYSSGKPALGVGVGNVQCIIDRDVDLKEAVQKIAAGRAFDNGIICAAEQTVICPKEKLSDVLKELERCSAYVIKEKGEKGALKNVMFENGNLHRQVVGRSAKEVAALAGLRVPENTKLIAVIADGIGIKDIFSKEKMCPVLAVYTYNDFEEAIEIAAENLALEGKGHSVSIHSNSVNKIELAGERLCISRLVVNQVCATSAGGSFYNGLAPTNTLGCGTWGNNSISENLDYKHLINISRIAYYMPDNAVPADEEIWG